MKRLLSLTILLSVGFAGLVFAPSSFADKAVSNAPKAEKTQAKGSTEASKKTAKSTESSKSTGSATGTASTSKK